MFKETPYMKGGPPLHKNRLAAVKAMYRYMALPQCIRRYTAITAFPLPQCIRRYTAIYRLPIASMHKAVTAMYRYIPLPQCLRR